MLCQLFFPRTSDVEKRFWLYQEFFVFLHLHMKRIWVAIVKMCGWHLLLPGTGERPELRRCVFVVAPHTAVSDFLVGAAYLWSLDVNGMIFIKKEFFRGLLGVVLRRLGAVPIDRGNRHNDMVGTAVTAFSEKEELSIIITPEATRKPVKRWKRGFWEIARRANVPIVPAYIDFSRKEVGLFDAMTPSDDFEADVAKIRRLYHKGMAKRPQQFIEVGQ